ncbi:hypothetical protein PPERSA_05706 [Pseudocohnilembus persalinus]|uniref:Uncharacterized protein n=1 Tax=Pseudocohnilembus persalinus TaxID=266149 RepID=A0A0V0QM97_PSEPJ|nr:hypothetical protein PPERSA_05706 [Pseudocohnilembus persalinus]|eukprot:KRX03348.1 hypothetical protein PPERSA_05706 [Pseudocohnilembus persalinus]
MEEQLKDFKNLELEHPFCQNPLKQEVQNTVPTFLSEEIEDRQEDKEEIPAEQAILRFHQQNQVPNIQYLAKAIQQNDQEKILNPPWTTITMKKIKTNQVLELLAEIYNKYRGKIPQLERIWLWYPDFLYFKEQLYTYIFEDGPLKPEFRQYIAIIASASMDCDYIFGRLTQTFLELGGDPQWIKIGQKALPSKLQKIQQLVNIMAYQPWVIIDKKIECNYIKQLKSGDEPWSNAEILHAASIILLIQFSCGYQTSFGILPEKEQYFQSQFNTQIESDLGKLNRKSSQLSINNQHKLFVLKGNEFSFKIHGVAIISEYDEQLGVQLLEFIETIKGMTNNRFGNNEYQTHPFRKAIRLYIENLLGYKHDDVNYKDHVPNMNDLLPKNLKNFLRIIIKRPKQMSQKDYDDIPLKGLDITEISHIILLALQAKMETCLTYLCSALIKND